MADPVEKAEDLAAEAERGRSERTPWLALGGVHLAVAALVGVVLAKRFGIAMAEPLVPSHPMLGDVDSPEALAEYQAAKRAYKAELRAAKSF